MTAEFHISESALRANYDYLQSLINVPLNPVVKADAYGLGTEIVTPLFQRYGAKLFFTATLEEAVKIRNLPEIKDDTHIAVLNGVSHGLEESYQHYNLIPVLNSLREIAHYQKFAEKTETKLPVMIHLDSGINRLGVRGQDIQKLANDANNLLAGLGIRAMLSHFISSDILDSPHNEMQRKNVIAFKKLFPHPFIVANSAGILLGKDYHFEGVKPGAILYGIYRNQFPNIANVVTIKAPILQISPLQQGDISGYDATFTTTQNIITATVSYGYADGYLRYDERNLKTKPRFAMLHGVKVPLIGRVSMDLTLFDITEALKIKSVTACDKIILLGDDYDANNLAADCNTIAHEVLTRAGKRVKRLLKE